jgi:hypothetical protein
MKAKIFFSALVELKLPEWAEGETDQEKLDEWLASAEEEPLLALQCLKADWIITGMLKNES